MNSTTIDKPKSKRPRKFAREPQGEASAANVPSTSVAASSAMGDETKPKPKTKAGLLLDLLARPEGATLKQMVAATDWLPHTTRAALTGLKKKGYTVTSTKADGVRTYRVVTAKGEPITAPAETQAEVDA